VHTKYGSALPISKVVQLESFRRSKKHVSFHKTELRELMNVYSRRVASGEWRDYAIDHMVGMAIFSIYRSSFETPLFRIAKVAGRSVNEQTEWMVVSRGERLKRSTSLTEVLAVFDKKLEVTG
jgi:hypothetical protein